MAIPRIVANEGSASTSGILTRAEPLAFSDPLAISNLGQGLANFGSGVADLGEKLRIVEERKALANDSRWVNDQSTTLRDEFAVFRADPANNTAEDFAKQFKSFADKRVKETRAKAPSLRARDALDEAILPHVSSKFAESLFVQEKTRLENTKEEVIENISAMIGTYRVNQGNLQGDVLGDLKESMDEMTRHIDQTFGELAPKTAKSLRAYMEEEVATGVSGEYPDVARAIIEDSSNLSETEKKSILGRLDVINKSVSAEKTVEFKRLRDDAKSRAAAGGDTTPIPLDHYLSSFPTELSARAAKDDDDQFFAAAAKSRADVERLQDKRADIIQSELSKLANGLDTGTAVDSAAYAITENMLNKVIKLQEQDPVGFLEAFNPDIQNLAKRARQQIRPADKNVETTAKNDRILQYQGFADDQTPPEDVHKYLGLATGQRRIMSNETARKTAAFLNSATPEEFLGKMQEMMDFNYPTLDQQYHAFNDMVNLPGGDGIKQSYQLIWQNKDEWWTPSLITALQNSKDFQSLAEDKKKDLDAAIDKTSAWRNFQQAMLGPNQDRPQDVAGFKSAISTYANFLSTQPGMTTEEAGKKAVELVISSTMAFPIVNGRPTAINAKDETGNKRTPEQVSDVGRRLTLALGFLDVQTVNQDLFPFLDEIHPDKQNINRLQKLRDTITQGGFWVTENDGDTMSLYLMGSTGMPVQLRDFSDRPYVVNINDVPNFEREIPFAEGEFGFIPKPTVKIKDQPQARYPLLEMRMNVLKSIATGQPAVTTTTNFPVQPGWMQNPSGPYPYPLLAPKK